jgi:hypothetical protein
MVATTSLASFYAPPIATASTPASRSVAKAHVKTIAVNVSKPSSHVTPQTKGEHGKNFKVLLSAVPCSGGEAILHVSVYRNSFVAYTPMPHIVPENVAFCVTLSAGPKMSGVKRPIPEGPTYPNGNTYGEQTVLMAGSVHPPNATPGKRTKKDPAGQSIGSAHRVTAQIPTARAGDGPQTSTKIKLPSTAPLPDVTFTPAEPAAPALTVAFELKGLGGGDAAQKQYNHMLVTKYNGDLELLQWDIAQAENNPEQLYLYTSAHVQEYALAVAASQWACGEASTRPVINLDLPAQGVIAAVKALRALWDRFYSVSTLP